MVTRVSRFGGDWWVVPKRLIYIVIVLSILGVIAGGAGVYVWVYVNPFKGAPTDTASPMPVSTVSGRSCASIGSSSRPAAPARVGRGGGTGSVQGRVSRRA